MDSQILQLLNDLDLWINQEKHSKTFCQSFDRAVLKKEIVEKVEPKKLYSFPTLLSHVDIVLLNMSSKKEEKELVERMGQAIDKHIAKAVVYTFEKNKDVHFYNELKQSLKNVQWVLISEPQVFEDAQLVKHYLNNPPTLFGRPAFVLGSLSSYLESVELKKKLWVSLQDKLR